MNRPLSTREGVWTEGSYLIERYVFRSVKGKPGVQWLVHRVERGSPVMLKVCKTRREAAEFVGSHRA